MSNGVIITQEGIDIRNAQDYQKALDSRWKSLDIAYEEDIDFLTPSFSGANGTRTFEIFRHDLAKLPGFEFQLSSKSGGNIDVVNGANIASFLTSDENAIYLTVSWFSGYSTFPLRVVGKLRVYDINFRVPYSAPQLGIQVPGGSLINNIGAAFTDQRSTSKRVTSRDFEDFTLNTRAKSLNIQKYGIAAPVLGVITVQHTVGYPPSYMIAKVFTDVVGNKTISAMTPTPTMLIQANTVDITFKGIQVDLDGEYAYLILKDPADVAS